MPQPIYGRYILTKIVRVLVPLDSQDDQTFRLAMAYATHISEAAGASDVVLLTHTKSQLDGTRLTGFLGSAAAKSLAKKNPVRLASGGMLRHETIKTMGYQARNAVIVAYYANATLLDFVDGRDGVAGVVTVPWVPGEADGWTSRWNAHVHGREREGCKELIDDPVVVSALETLTSLINLSTGLGHPSDKRMADEILRILRAKGHADPSGNVKSWAISKNWKPAAASDLQTLSRKIWSLKSKPNLSTFHDPDGRYNRWKTGAG